MLITIQTFKDVDKRKLMDIYAESNRENVPYFFPDCTVEKQGIEQVEKGFLDFLQNEFFAVKSNAYYVWEERGEWLSALRLNYIKNGFYYIEALETAPGCRNRGFACRLINAVLEKLKAHGEFEVRSSVGKGNAASLATHKKCGFIIAEETATDFLDGSRDDRCYGLRYVGKP